MENNVNISLDYYNRLRDTEKKYHDITESSCAEIVYGYSYATRDYKIEKIVTTDEAIRQLNECNNRIINELNRSNSKIQDQEVFLNRKGLEIEEINKKINTSSFKSRLFYLLTGKLIIC